MIEINTANRTHIDGRDTGLALTQRREGTIIYTPESTSTNYREHPMPRARYSTAFYAPASGAAGRAELERDARELLARLAR